MSLTQTLIEQAEPHWAEYVQHPFVEQLAAGTLPETSFRHYLKQDYLYLFQYTRMFALAMYKSENFAQMETARGMAEAVLSEIDLHIAYCREWGISEAELFATEESAACIAYTRYVLDCGISGTLAELYAAVAPCMLGYAEIGKRIGAQPPVPGNPYQAWIDTYAAEDFQQVAVDFSAFFDSLCQDLTPAQQAKIAHIFTTATRMEVAFWDMGLHCRM
ncbi:thiaminase II [Bergeriella denitrificans]|uniref:Aminopyrimidine aminohydrolase n=2 Tax=Bergeriella denitrificans TaxID=494 RepID=A0A378UHR9_BERDE|nr:thiaminase II [Bergeriella denitrificans]STZ76022.1 Thiaminase-2 [Bergeriella denitrificans]